MEAKVLNAADILGCEDLKPQIIEVPEWGGSIRIKPLTAAQALEFSNAKKEDGTALLVIASVIDEQGNQLFNEAHLTQLKKKSIRALMRVQEAVLTLNGLDKGGVTAAKNA